ncbi:MULTISPECIES: hypothetical protein [Burkholderia]|uniref:hypothetical protein n=1 Tax=Burkholderia TaxID=32008 RepID=UPI000C0066A5|nr:MULTISPECIES: hypothetical protein [Burkholderia]PFH20314.1 hypothetical protein BX604_4704 [Burkholderia sp. JKS000303]
MTENVLKFSASVVSCYMEGEASVIGIGDDKNFPENYIIITRFDDGGVDESIGVSTNRSDGEVSGSVMAVSLNKYFFDVFIRPDREADIGASHILVDLSSAEFDFHIFSDYLCNIFLGSSAKLVIADS